MSVVKKSLGENLIETLNAKNVKWGHFNNTKYLGKYERLKTAVSVGGKKWDLVSLEAITEIADFAGFELGDGFYFKEKKK